MKKIKLLFFFLVFSFSSFAQQAGRANVKGVIQDIKTQKPIAFASVSIFQLAEGQASAKKEALADEKGIFSIADVPFGTYQMLVSFVGYSSKTLIDLKIDQANFLVDTIKLEDQNTVLSTVEVVADKPLIENKLDKIVYNAEKDVTTLGGNATDVLRKVPLLSVDMDGNVSLRGDQNVKILINGKASGAMANNVGEALKMIPADQISNVEVITSPSAKYDGEGTSGIINIITKKKTVAGVNGSVTAGIGTRQNSTNANINVKQGKLGVVANGGVNWMWPQVTTNDFTQMDHAGNITLQQLGQNHTTRVGGRGSIGIDYDFNDKNLLTTNFTYNQFDMDFDGSSESFFMKQAFLSSKRIQNTGMDGIDGSASYTRKFDREKQELTVAGQFSRSNSNTDYSTLYDDDNRFDELGLNLGRNDELTFLVDYSHPFSKSLSLDVGAKAIFRDILSDVSLDQIIGGQKEFQDDRSYQFNYNQDVMAAYGSVQYNLGRKYQAMVGLRVEHTLIDGQSAGTLPGFQNDYLNVLPNAVISRALGRMSSLKLSYNQRIQRPSMFYLNPFRNTSDPINQSQGNPGLKPELAHNFELAYSTFHKGLVFNASVYYRLTDQVIETLFTNEANPDGSEIDIVLQTFDNIGTNKSLGTNIFTSYSPIKPLTLRANLSVSTYNTAASSNLDANLSTELEKTHLMYRAFVNASYVISPGFTAETFYILNSPKRTFQGTSPSFSMWSLGLKKEVFNKQGSIGLNILDPFTENKVFKSEVFAKDYVQKSNFSVPFRSFGITATWNFGKLNFKDSPRKNRGIVNDDQKKEETQQQGAGGQ